MIGLRGNLSRIGAVSVLGGVLLTLMLFGMVFARENSDDGNKQLKLQAKKISGTVKKIDSRRGFIVIAAEEKEYRLEASSRLLEKFRAGERVLVVTDGSRIKYIRRIERIPPNKKNQQERKKLPGVPAKPQQSTPEKMPHPITAPVNAPGQ